MSSKIVVAIDDLGPEASIELTRAIGKRVRAVKIHGLYDSVGPDIVGELYDAGAELVWVDAKLHDTPDTVRIRARELADVGAKIITVHASGEIDMMMAALEGVEAYLCEIYAITMLTSLDEELTHLLAGQPVKAAVLYRARLAKLANVPAVVCSAKEVGMLAKRRELQGLTLVTPGVRSVGKDTNDQKRVDTPANAIKNGAHYIVVGRQLTQAKDPVAALDAIEAELAEVESVATA